MKSENKAISKQLKDALANITNLTSNLKRVNHEFQDLQEIASRKTSENTGKDETIAYLQKQINDKSKYIELAKAQMDIESNSLKEKLELFEKEGAELRVKL